MSILGALQGIAEKIIIPKASIRNIGMVIQDPKKLTMVATYTRKSTNSETKQQISIQRQEIEIQMFCEQNNMLVVKRFSESQSGQHNNRPQFKKMIEWLDESANHIVVISNVSRLARNLRVWEHIEKRLYQFRFVELGNQIPTMFIVNMFLSVATQESINISNRVKASYKVLKERFGDELKWGNPEIHQHSKAGNERKTELMIEHWKPILFLEALIYSKFKHTMSLKDRVQWLNDEGKKTRRGNPITPQNILRAHKQLKTGGVKVLAQFINEIQRD